ncbi:hypothetical protein ACQ4N7_00750 [Nodosilinea sp. AN01ver1]|uniref:hypothetical protein n=1 Tax=Nodosilinea sp. AN01ver1 TaxID=3423362 RepID=UPI003D31B122
MPDSTQIGFLVIGGILILIAIVGGNFKLFGAEVASTVSNKFLRFVAFVLGVFLLILAVGLSSPESLTSVSPQSDIPSAQSSQTPSIDESFVGSWTSEGEIGATYLMNLDISSVQNSELSGVLNVSNLSSGYNIIDYSVVGEIEGEVTTLEIFDTDARQVGKAELSVEDGSLVWRLIRAQDGYFPGTIHLSKRVA